uniref:Mitochondrial import inner membrane translocase subunit n=1 Tax=Glossina austeni TaxID=7395 RepID=A0A1A9UMP9_GLOAU
MSDLMTSTTSEKEEIIEEVKQQLAAANAQELLTKMTEKCFCKCITRPGAQLNSSEQKCISMCMDRFIDSWNLVSRAYGTRIQREQNRILSFEINFENFTTSQFELLLLFSR